MIKDLLLLDPSINFTQIASDRLFYDRWQYCMHFRLEELSVMRDLDHADITRRLIQNQNWREHIRRRWPQNNFVRTHRDISEITHARLHDLCDLLLAHSPDSYKLVITVDQGRVYTNNLDLIHSLTSVAYLENKRYTEAVIARSRDTVVLKGSKFKFRSYFTSIKLTLEAKNSIKRFFDNQEIRLGPSTVKWFEQPYLRSQDYFFIDYNDLGCLVMLNLVQPGLIRKTLTIVTK